MDPTIFGIIIGSVVAPLLLLVLSAYMQRRKDKAQEQSFLGGALEGAGTTIEKLFKRLDENDAWKEKAELRIEFLETELKRYVNWSGRLMLHIKKIDPDGVQGEAPTLDTDPKLRAALGRK